MGDLADDESRRALGQYAIGGGSHDEAVRLLARVQQPDGKELSKRLGRLLGVKTKAGYVHRSVTATDRKTAKRAAGNLVKAARDL